MRPREEDIPVRTPFVLGEGVVHDHGSVGQPAGGEDDHDKGQHLDHLKK